MLSPEPRYSFYITNRRDLTMAEVVELTNDRCNQENLHAQLEDDVRALRAPVDPLVSNWAYMIAASARHGAEFAHLLTHPASRRSRPQHSPIRLFEG